MNINKQNFDDYITFILYEGCVLDYFDADFVEENGDWLDDDGGLYYKWLNKLFTKYIPPDQAAKIIERGYTVFLK